MKMETVIDKLQIAFVGISGLILSVWIENAGHPGSDEAGERRVDRLPIGLGGESHQLLAVLGGSGGIGT